MRGKHLRYCEQGSFTYLHSSCCWALVLLYFSIKICTVTTDTFFLNQQQTEFNYSNPNRRYKLLKKSEIVEKLKEKFNISKTRINWDKLLPFLKSAVQNRCQIFGLKNRVDQCHHNSHMDYRDLIYDDCALTQDPHIWNKDIMKYLTSSKIPYAPVVEII